MHNEILSKLLACPLHGGASFVALAPPASWRATLDGQGITPPADHQGEGSEEEKVKENQE